jgi:hypothetical protein
MKKLIIFVISVIICTTILSVQCVKKANDSELKVVNKALTEENYVRIVIPDSTLPRLEWTHNWKDVQGQPERVLYFRIYRSVDGGNLSLVGHTPVDDVTFRPPTTYTDSTFWKTPGNNFVYGIEAVDAALNTSLIHMSTDSSAYKGGWYLAKDLVKPAAPTGLRIISVTF